MNHDTSKHSPFPELNAFIQEFESANEDSNQWDFQSRDRLDQLAKDVLHRSHGKWSRPEDVKTSLWVRMQETFMHAAHSIKTSEAGYTLAFLPITIGIHGVNHENPLILNRKSWNLYDVDLVLNDLFDGVRAKAFPLVISEDYLGAANPAMLQKLLRDLISGEDINPDWNQSESLTKLAFGAYNFYMPVLLTTPNPLPVGWSYTDALDQGLDIDGEVMDHMARSFEDMLYGNHDDVEIFCGAPEVVPLVIEFSKTNRDLQFLDMQCGEMHNFITGGDPNVPYEKRVEVILGWGPENTYMIKRSAVPSVMVRIEINSIGAKEGGVWSMPICTSSVPSDRWPEILRDILAIMHNRQWYNTTIIQKTSETALQEWNSRPQHMYLM